VTIKVKNKAGKVVKTLRPVVKPVNAALTWKFTVPCSRGDTGEGWLSRSLGCCFKQARERPGAARSA